MGSHSSEPEELSKPGEMTVKEMLFNWPRIGAISFRRQPQRLCALRKKHLNESLAASLDRFFGELFNQPVCSDGFWGFVLIYGLTFDTLVDP